MALEAGWEGTELVLQMGRITGGNLTRDEAMGKIVRLLLDSFPVEAASILIYDSTTKSVYVASSSFKTPDMSMIPEDITLKVQAGSCLAQALQNPKEPVFVRGSVTDPVLGKLPGCFSVVVPMASGTDVAGFMVLAGSKDPGNRGLAPELLMAVGSQIAIITAKEKLVESLKQSEERYHSLMENASDLVFVLDRGGRFLYVNSRSADILGYPPENIVGRYFGEFVTPDSWAYTVTAVKKAVAQKRKHIQYSWVIGREGREPLTFNVRASLIYRGYRLLMHQGIARDESVEKKLQAELIKRDQELGQSKSREVRMREYLTVANVAQEEERARIARELHDGAVQYLIALKRRLELLRKSLPAPQPDGNPKSPGKNGPFQDLNSIDVLVDTAIDDLRKFARNLRPPVLDDFGLVSACEWLCDQVEKEGIRVAFETSGDVRRLSQDVEISAFRIAQEALANSVKHSEATRVDFSLEFCRDKLVMRQKDNGRGFDLRQSPGSLARAGQMGLIGMFERAELLRATIKLESERGRGTTLLVTIPICVSTKPVEDGKDESGRACF